MQKIYLILACVCVIGSSSIERQNRIEINIPTIEEETNYIWRNIQDIKFFEQYNYQVKFPDDKIIDTLLQKARANNLQDADYKALKKQMTERIYNSGDYQKGFSKIKNNTTLINKIINSNSKKKRKWPFKEFDTYQINLTLYGPGGSYNNENGSILIFTTKEGAFKQYDDPSNTIIHEIIHIGIEDSIIQKYGVSHPDKERIVDRYVSILFAPRLSDYRMQQMGNEALDEILKTKKDICDLEAKIKNYMMDKKE